MLVSLRKVCDKRDDEDDEAYTKKKNNVMLTINVGPKTLHWGIPLKCKHILNNSVKSKNKTSTILLVDILINYKEV